MKKIIIVITMLILSSIAFGEQKYKAILLGDEYGNIYYQENIDTLLPLASVTKMMSLAVVYDEIEKGNIKYDNTVFITKDIENIGGSSIWLKEGMEITVLDLIKATAIYSANNAVTALGRYVGYGDEDKFVNMMNEKAKEYGIENQVSFYTPSGLPPHMTNRNMDIGCASGLYQLGMKVEKIEDYMKIASMKESIIKTGKIQNRNKLLGIDGIYGIKTGHHSKAGYNIVIASNKNEIKTFVVVLGSKNEKDRDETVLELIKKFHKEYERKEILNQDVSIGKIKLLNKEILLYPDKNLNGIFKKDSKFIIEVDKENLFKVLLDKNKKYGKYRVLQDDKEILSGELVTGE